MTVRDYFNRWMAEFPSLSVLAKAPLEVTKVRQVEVSNLRFLESERALVRFRLLSPGEIFTRMRESCGDKVQRKAAYDSRGIIRTTWSWKIYRRYFYFELFVHPLL